MNDGTRRVRVHGTAAGPQAGIGTMTFGSPPPRVSARDLHARVHRLLRSAVLEQPRAGLFVFAVHGALGEVGRLWLAASGSPRAATIGRHETVDLALRHDPGLSLRHLLFVVRQVQHRVRYSALDLATPAGLAEVRAQVSQVESSNPLLLTSAGLSFFCVPTGPGAVLSENVDHAWTQLSASRGSDRSRAFALPTRAGPVCGRLTVSFGAHCRAVEVTPAVLRAGVLLGRADRCDLVIPDRCTSRVHAVVVSIDGGPHLIDAGSGNGTRHVNGQRAHCWRLADRDAFRLGEATVEWRSL